MKMWFPPYCKRFIGLLFTTAVLLSLTGEMLAGRSAALGSLYGSLVAFVYLFLLILSSGQVDSKKFRWWNVVLSFRFFLTLMLLLIGYKTAFLSFFWMMLAFFFQYPLFFVYGQWKIPKSGSGQKKGGE